MKRKPRTSQIVTGTIAAVGMLIVTLAVVISVHAMVGKTVLGQVTATASVLAGIDQEIAVLDRRAIAQMEQGRGIWSAILPPLGERMSILPGLGNAPDRSLQGQESPEHWLTCARPVAASGGARGCERVAAVFAGSGRCRGVQAGGKGQEGRADLAAEGAEGAAASAEAGSPVAGGQLLHPAAAGAGAPCLGLRLRRGPRP